MDTSQLANIAQIVSVAAASLFGIYRFWRKVERNQAEVGHTIERLEGKIDTIERQFGPNGGGLREAVNNMSKTVSKIDDRVSQIGNDLSRLSGEFSQHIRETEGR